MELATSDSAHLCLLATQTISWKTRRSHIAGSKDYQGKG